MVDDSSLNHTILLLNKKYESGIPVQISVYKDKLYIANTGVLTNDWPAQNLYDKHPSQPYNPNVAYVFYLAGHFESWMRGIEKMFDSCRNNNLLTPVYHAHSTDIMIQFNASSELVVDKGRLV